MIEIERDAKPVDGTRKWRWWVRRRPEICGFSSEPLLDACRALKRMGEPTSELVGLFRSGSSTWDLRTTVGYGASVTVDDGPRIGPRFIKYKQFPGLTVEPLRKTG